MSNCPVCGCVDFLPIIQEREYHWVRCRDCDFVKIAEDFSFEAVTSAQDAAIGTVYVTGALKKFDKKVVRARRRVGMLLSRHKGETFLDIGCNLGFITAAARKRGLDATGLEINQTVVEFAQERFPECRFICSPLETAALPDNHFDFVYCSEVIEHVADFRLFLGRILGVMKPGALLYLTTPHIREYRRKNYRQMSAPEHKFYFNNANLARVLKECGFSGVRFRFNGWKGIELFATKPPAA